MSKSLQVILFAAAMMPVASFAADPIIAYVGEINVGGSITTPTGIDAYNGDLFVGEFGSGAGTRRILKIASPLSVTPALTIFATATDAPSTPTAFPVSRGLQGLFVNQANGDVWAFGDDGAVGHAYRYDSTGTLIDGIPTTGTRTVSGALWGSDPDLILCRVASSSLTEIPAVPMSVTFESTSVLAAAPVNANFRDVVVVGDDVYYTRNGTTSDAIGKYSGGTAGDFASYTASTFATFTGINAVGAFGLGKYTHPGSGKTYILGIDITAQTVQFINTAGAAVDVTVADAAHLSGGIRDVCVGTIASKDYLFVTQTSASTASPTVPNSVQIFSIDATPSSVNDWTIY